MQPKAISALERRVVHPADQWEVSAVVLEYDSGARDRSALAHRLGHFEFKGDGSVDVDQLALCTQSIEELSKIVERHSWMLHTSCVAVASRYNKYPVQPPAARVTVRQFALAVHQSEGVPAACVLLQDRFDLDVNVLLLAAYVGAVRGQTFTPDSLEAVRAVTDPWQRQVVRPLRAVRRRLKTGPAPAPDPRTDEVRSGVKKAELDAELIELDELGRWVDGLASPPAAGDATNRARAAMDVVVHDHIPGALSDEESLALAAIAQAASHHSEVGQ